LFYGYFLWKVFQIIILTTIVTEDLTLDGNQQVSNIKMNLLKNCSIGNDPVDALYFIYAILYSPAYRKRYAGALSIEFPKIPNKCSPKLAKELIRLGGELVALHLLEGVDKYTSKQVGKFSAVRGQSSTIAKGYPKYDDGKVYINAEAHFAGVPTEVWEFHIGGYQVCQKWLKDRRERELSAEDIVHYGKVVSALGETIRIMREVDGVIESAGGWAIK